MEAPWIQNKKKARKRWIDDVDRNFKTMNNRQWRRKVSDRAEWKIIVKHAKTHKGFLILIQCYVIHEYQFLLFLGDPDEHVYIVQSGKLSVSITGNDGLTTLKIVKPGESVTSLLSFTDVLTGHTSPYKTVSAKAIEDSMVVKLPMSAFQEIFQEYPDIFVRVLQVIMVRLQRVTFTALHQYLGLSAELVRQHPKQKNSPMKKKKEESSLNTTLTETPTATTQPIPVPGHRRSKSSLESKSFSPSGNFGNGMAESDSIPSGTVSDCGSIPKKRLSIQNPDINDEELIEVATEAFVKELGLEDLDSLKGKVEIREVSAGTYLMKEDSNKVNISLISFYVNL
uniref:Neuropathy target esterase sws-like n=1 Tax=Diabrotica virgifera virgifera TaxID=50390 RepID=A0A6P7GUC6_DIAVI